MVEKRFEKLGMPDIERFENYLPTAFNSELTLLQKVNKIIFDLIETNKLTNEMVDYLNRFIETFDEKLYETIDDILSKWLEDGILTELIRNAINEEVVEARNDYSTLKERLDSENTDVNTQLSQTNTQLTQNVNDLSDRGLNGKRFGMVVDGSEETDLLQEFVDYCYENNLKALLSGETTINKQVTIMCDFDFSQLKIKQHHEGVGLMIGKENSNARESGVGYLPEMVKEGLEWGQSIAIQLKNLNRWTLYIHNKIVGFGKGLFLTANNYGTAYNNIFWNYIINNKVNIEIYATKTGWVNENVFYGGSATHTVERGTALDDVHVLKIHMETGSILLPDNNIFYSPSFEGSVPRYPIVIKGGQYNTIYSGRYEPHGGFKFKILLSGTSSQPSQWNGFIGGYGLNSAELVNEGSARGNYVESAQRITRDSQSSVPIVQLTNRHDDKNPVFVAKGIDGETMIEIAPNSISLKSRGDEHPRIKLNVNGHIQMGTGAEPPTTKIRNTAVDVSFDKGIGTQYSTFDENVLRLGQYYIWVATDGYLRMKLGKPTHSLDGNPVSKPE